MYDIKLPKSTQKRMQFESLFIEFKFQKNENSENYIEMNILGIGDP